MKRARIFLLLAALTLAALACVVPGLPMDDVAFATVVARTVEAALTEKYVSPTPTATATVTLTPSVTPVPPTETATLPPSVTPTITVSPIPTNTIEIPPNKLIVTVSTNCRSGPDKSFSIQGTLLEGESTEVYGVDPSGRYFYVANPDPGAPRCWISGKYAVVSGSISMAPQLTAEPTYTPTPTATLAPAFSMKYSSLEVCGDWWLNMELANNGQIAFQSVVVRLIDGFTEKMYVTSANVFEAGFECNPNKSVIDSLDPGQTALVSSAALGKDPTGSKVTVKVTVCTQPEGNGQCLTESLTFKPK